MYEEQKEIVFETAKKLLAKGLTLGSSGNITLRTEKKGTKMIGTPSGKDIEDYTIDDMLVIDFSDESGKFEVIEGNLTASSETYLHMAIYKARRDVNAIIHYHPVYSTAVGLVLDDYLPAILDDQVFFLGHPIVITSEYNRSGSTELAKHISEVINKTSLAIIIRNHGSLGFGKNMRRAFLSCELLEKTAQIYFIANMMGKIKYLDEEAIKMGKAIFKALK
ncbi:MAG: class II aldolase/adducin family protein [Candidatus Hodarchaeota archaeon]